MNGAGVNGGGSQGLSLAQKMMQQHEQSAKTKTHAQRPSMEIVDDEDDIAHPATHDTTPGPVLEELDGPPAATPSWVQPMSDKAAGKQKENGQPAGKREQPLDLKSDEAFPSLGGSKPAASAATPSWGSKGSDAVRSSNGATNGTNASSRPTTGAVPVRLRGPGGQLQLPGRTNQLTAETFTFLPEQMTPRSQLKKPMNELLRDVQTRTKATIDTSTSSSGIATFIIKGAPDAVRRAKREIGRELGLKKSITVPVPIWSRPHIIGRGGTTIQKIGERTGTRVQMPKPGENEEDDEATVDVAIDGDAAGVDQAKAEIERIVKERANLPRTKREVNEKGEPKKRVPAEDEITLTLKIKPQYHRELIGARGSQVNRLQDRYDVRINFPRSAPSAAASDAGSEYGGGRAPRPSQASDEVIIRGPRKGAEEARDELVGLLEYIAQNSYTDTVSVQGAQISSLIGQGGREVSNLRLETGAQIDVPQIDKENGNPSERVTIRLKGTKEQVEKAKKIIQERAKVFDKTVVKTINVDKKHHKALIGGQGAKIRDIVVGAGGSDDRRELARTVRFPKPESDDNEIRVEGDRDVVNKIVAEIEKMVRERESSVTSHVDVEPSSHRILIGRGGETRQNLEKEFNVSIDIPRQQQPGSTTPAGRNIKVSGQPSDVERAQARIEQMVREHQGQAFEIPRHLHHTISDNGQFFRKLKNDHKVTVDHSGHNPPAKPDAASRQRRLISSDAGDEPLPLITDAVVTESISWEIYDMGFDSMPEQETATTIPWVLRGPPENVLRAAALLQAAIDQAQRETVTGYLVLPDPTVYRHVIGHGGSQVNAIRKQTGCRIVVPGGGNDRGNRNHHSRRNNSIDIGGFTPEIAAGGDAIEIWGSQDDVEKAKAIILEVVTNAVANGGGGEDGSRRRGPR